MGDNKGDEGFRQGGKASSTKARSGQPVRYTMTAPLSAPSSAIPAVTVEQAVEMATLGGATAMRWDEELGSLQEGKEADIVIFDTDDFDWTPLHNPLTNLVYNSGLQRDRALGRHGHRRRRGPGAEQGVHQARRGGVAGQGGGGGPAGPEADRGHSQPSLAGARLTAGRTGVGLGDGRQRGPR